MSPLFLILLLKCKMTSAPNPGIDHIVPISLLLEMAYDFCPWVKTPYKQYTCQSPHCHCCQTLNSESPHVYLWEACACWPCSARQMAQLLL